MMIIPKYSLILNSYDYAIVKGAKKEKTLKNSDFKLHTLFIELGAPTSIVWVPQVFYSEDTGKLSLQLFDNM